MKNDLRFLLYLFFLFLTVQALQAKSSTGPVQVTKPLAQLQQEFLDLRFGMFIHFNIPTYGKHDWPDPNLSPEVFNPKKLNCDQWADAAVSAGMTYGCLTTKHHSGFCLWPTKTTDYNVMSSPCKRDVVKEYADAFRKKGLKVFIYYSILDTHHYIRPGWIKKEHTQFIKDQLTELLTNYGEISCLVIDGWDSPWSRISYEDVSFEEIYRHVKSLQPNCLISEMNAAKYPAEYMFYNDIKFYEQNAGQVISRETNKLPALACVPINKNWFWKDFFPKEPVKSAKAIVDDNLVPLNKAYCNFILNVAPNPDGLIDDNALAELKKIGQIWKHEGSAPKLPFYQKPVIASNLAKKQKINSSWSLGTGICDKANDDDYRISWRTSTFIQDHFLEIVFDKETEFNAVGFVEGTYADQPNGFKTRLNTYNIQYWDGTRWKGIPSVCDANRVRIHRFQPVKATKVRVNMNTSELGAFIAEIMVYNEQNNE